MDVEIHGIKQIPIEGKTFFIEVKFINLEKFSVQKSLAPRSLGTRSQAARKLI